eukprot:CAMPEP_0196575104 /NCGR_PEP_ID=MMETSP1081-20130531/4663_1 /TAXON_ID=36882 /ORGANISM="Pyramimonas amylifera, Strain CCMP720" /LENGTH=447 /DNA_ID=CAMNT_0041893305 /DNA_START=25 /DNA_END=1368 /DNA_ORIENTATION=+
MSSLRSACSTSQTFLGSFTQVQHKRQFDSKPCFNDFGFASKKQPLSKNTKTKKSDSVFVVRALGIHGWEDKEIEEKKSGSRMAPQSKLHETAEGRVIAIGDLHGDIAQTIRCLQLAGVVSVEAEKPSDVHWTGGNTVVVQLGDVLDRGDDEIGILLLLRKLGAEARDAGGAVHMLNGNHEVLNVAGDFRYVTPGAFVEADIFSDLLEDAYGENNLEEGVPCFRMKTPGDRVMMSTQELCDRRVRLFAPGGVVAQQLANNRTVLVINDTCYVHGGLLPKHIEYGLEHLNTSMSRWMRGEFEEDIQVALDLAAGSKSSVVWNRMFSNERILPADWETMYAITQQVLDGLSEECGVEVKRLVMGHTVQRSGINSELDGLVWRVDIGVSNGVLGASPEVLEIQGEDVSVLRYGFGQANRLKGIDSTDNVNTVFEELSCSAIDHAYLLRSNL